MPGAPSSGTPWESVWCTKGAKSTGTGASGFTAEEYLLHPHIDSLSVTRYNM